jgi:RNA polymerase sigma factor (sigma-70 family)
MACGQLETFIRQLRRRLRPQGGGLADAELLRRWLGQHDEAAFEVLLWRHGPMALGVCRRVLRHAQDVEDAFQATFLTLVRKAATIDRQEAVAGWLYRVAHRVALRARERAARRTPAQPWDEQLAPVEPETDLPWRDLRPLLDDEVQRLPAKYRAAFVLCHVQGKTNGEAARELGCPPGTIASRLAWARQRLRSRLTRHGLTLSAGLLSTVLASAPAEGAVPPALVDATLEAVRGSAGRAAAGSVSARVAGLMEGGKGVAITRLSMTVVLLLSLAGLGLAALLAIPTLGANPAERGGGGKSRPSARKNEARPARGKDRGPQERRKLQGTWVPLALEGIRIRADDIPEATLVVAGDRITLNPRADRRVLTYRLDPGRRPPAIDLTPLDGKAKGKTLRGIYSLDGDFLEICFDPTPGGKRPRAFVTTPNFGGKKLLVLKRAGRQVPPALERSRYHLKAIALALYDYQRRHGRLPPAAVCDKDGKPLCSWRVLLLPYIEQKNLYRLVRQDQPWDSRANQPATQTVIKLFAPLKNTNDPLNFTFYRAITGTGTAFTLPTGARLQDVTRGNANPILVAEAGQAVPWTKPDELPYSPNQPLPRLGGLFKDGFHVLRADGSVRFLKKKDLNEKRLRQEVIGKE